MESWGQCCTSKFRDPNTQWRSVTPQKNGMLISKNLSHKSCRTPVNRTPKFGTTNNFEGISNISVRTYDVLETVWCEPMLVHVENLINKFILFVPCIVNELQIVTVSTIAQFHYYVIHSQLAPPCFGLTAIIRKLTPVLLKLTAIK